MMWGHISIERLRYKTIFPREEAILTTDYNWKILFDFQSSGLSHKFQTKVWKISWSLSFQGVVQLLHPCKWTTSNAFENIGTSTCYWLHFMVHPNWQRSTVMWNSAWFCNWSERWLIYEIQNSDDSKVIALILILIFCEIFFLNHCIQMNLTIST